MVRFIIVISGIGKVLKFIFTFQYGQIYYTTGLPFQQLGEPNLHSNMVRFIMYCLNPLMNRYMSFTFQYGQIYYLIIICKKAKKKSIYIPIWLDLLLYLYIYLYCLHKYLHSNMVRFIMFLNAPFSSSSKAFTFQYGQIYYFEI